MRHNSFRVRNVGQYLADYPLQRLPIHSIARHNILSVCLSVCVSCPLCGASLPSQGPDPRGLISSVSRDTHICYANYFNHHAYSRHPVRGAGPAPLPAFLKHGTRWRSAVRPCRFITCCRTSQDRAKCNTNIKDVLQIILTHILC
jgi:hypothetical protein